MPALNIAANQVYARPFQAAREGKALRAASALRRIHLMLSEQALKDFYLTATEEEIKALERIEAKHK